eukprot:SAG31_NODE_6486_length_1999_cov_2.051579_2_plen_425_part_01
MPEEDGTDGGNGRPGSTDSQRPPSSTAVRPASANAPPLPPIDTTRPGSVLSVRQGGEDGKVDETFRLNEHIASMEFGREPAPFRGPPLPSGDPIYRDLNRTRAIVRNQGKITQLEVEKRELAARLQGVEKSYVSRLSELDQELRTVRETKLNETSSLAERVQRLERELKETILEKIELERVSLDAQAEADVLRRKLAVAQEGGHSATRMGDATIRQLEFKIEHLCKDKQELEVEVGRLRASEEEANKRAESCIAKSSKADEELNVHYGELRKLRSMTKALNARRQTEVQLEVELTTLRNQLEESETTRVAAEEEYEADTVQRLQQIYDDRVQLKKQAEIAEVRKAEIESLREELVGKEQVILELADVTARLDVQQGRLEVLVEERENLLMASASAELHNLREKLDAITTERDTLKREVQVGENTM